MNSALADEALDVAAALRKALTAAGGMGLVRAAATDPSARITSEAALDSVGLWGLDPLETQLELEVAAAACHVAGHFALPYPLVERLGRRDAGATTLVAVNGPRIAAHVDLPLDWSALDLTGTSYRILRIDPEYGSQLAPFAARVEVTPADVRDPGGAALLCTLQAWWLLGLVEHALADTVQYAREREQFGQALITFQGAGFQLADMSVATQSLVELAKYTLWSLAQQPASALTDAVGLRLAALQTAGLVLRGAHQLHGAMGFTDEVGISWLSRASQVPRRLPEGEHRTAAVLTSLIERDGWSEFGHVGTSAMV